MQHLESFIDKLALSKFNENPMVKKIHTTTKLRSEYISLALLTITTLFFLITPWGHCILMSFSTYMYPAYKTFKALNSEDQEDDKRWMIYWTVYGFIFMFQSIMGDALHVISFIFFYCFN